MRLHYLFVSDGNAPYGSRPHWDSSLPSENHFAGNLLTEGFWYLWKRCLEEKIIDDCTIWIESTRNPGIKVYGPSYRCRVTPDISYFLDFLRPDDIVFVRGGFRSWFVMLNENIAGKHWILFYQAATNRGKWLFWDVVFNDNLPESLYDVHGRFHLHFRKPTSPEIFHPRKIKKMFDVCVGASHIHDKKGQWKVVKMLKAYKEIYGKHLCAVLPGRGLHGTNTTTMWTELPELDISTPGMVDRNTMCDIYNMSRLLIHLGGAGQNDRGVLEALTCGTPVMLSQLQYHAPITYSNPRVSFVTKNADNPYELAKEVHEILAKTDGIKDEVAQWYEAECGVDKTVEQMRQLFEVLSHKPDRSLCKTLLNTSRSSSKPLSSPG